MRDPLSSCAGKERFETYSMAQAVATRPSRRREARHNVYHCLHCGGFHIGTAKPKREKKAEAM